MSYRMTASAADADDVVQETFVRALSHPPARTDIPLLPWLVRVALNASRDLLRRRRKREYVGPWLPQPIELRADGAGSALIDSADVRYDLLESASFAFLLALEALSARQRAVLLLRDVFDYSVRETAVALDVSEGAVKTAHHRARRCMQDYDCRRSGVPAERTAEAQRALGELMSAVIAEDVAKVEALLTADARAAHRWRRRIPGSEEADPGIEKDRSRARRARARGQRYQRRAAPDQRHAGRGAQRSGAGASARPAPGSRDRTVGERPHRRRLRGARELEARSRAFPVNGTAALAKGPAA
jgi:RNA polymerase sigma factor (sigma-70 family)